MENYSEGYRKRMIRSIGDATLLSGYLEEDDCSGYSQHLDSLDLEGMRDLVTTLATALTVSSKVSADVITMLPNSSRDKFGITGSVIVAMTLARLRDEIDRVAP